MAILLLKGLTAVTVLPMSDASHVGSVGWFFIGQLLMIIVTEKGGIPSEHTHGHPQSLAPFWLNHVKSACHAAAAWAACCLLLTGYAIEPPDAFSAPPAIGALDLFLRALGGWVAMVLLALLCAALWRQWRKRHPLELAMSAEESKVRFRFRKTLENLIPQILNLPTSRPHTSAPPTDLLASSPHQVMRKMGMEGEISGNNDDETLTVVANESARNIARAKGKMKGAVL